MILTRTRRPRRRGAALLWFLLVALPLAYTGLAFSVDVARIVMVSRQAANVADAAAVSGAFQFNPGTARLNREAVQTVGTNTVRINYEQRSVKGTLNGNPNVAVSENGYGTERVTVTVRTDVDTYMLGTILNFLGGDPGATRLTLTTTKTADVCIPNRYTPTDGYCARPTSR